MKTPLRSALMVALALLTLAAGCTKIPLSSLWSLRQFSFEAFDPALLRVALHLPAGYAMRRDAVLVDAEVKRDGEAPSAARFTMHETRDPADARGLPAESAAGGRWIVLSLGTSEVERLRAFRQSLIARKAEGGKKKGSVSLGATPQMCRTGAPVPGTAVFSAALMWSREEGYVPLLRDADLDEMLQSLETPNALAALPAC
jgi:hypothetical protein